MRSRIRTVALIAFGGYVAWNVAWFFHGLSPPSVFSYCTGLPCPTTGMTRSILSACRGNVQDFLLFNPFTLVYLALMGASALLVLGGHIKGKEIALPPAMAWSWMAALALGWLAKFAIGGRYW